MFFDNLENLCKRKGLKLTPLLNELNISKGAISRWRKGTLPNGETLIKIADYFSCSVDYLLGRTNANNRNIVFTQNEQLTEQERRLLSAYRQNPNMQEAVNRLLRTEANITRAVRIARSNTSSVEVVYDDFSDLDNAPETDEDL